MPIIRIPTPLRYYTNGQSEIAISGKTVAEAMDQLFIEYATLRKQMVDENGQLRRFVNLFVNDENIRELDGLDTELKDADRLIIVPSIAGG
jgi:molybdopterin synthase sulfur carrier subunit